MTSPCHRRPRYSAKPERVLDPTLRSTLEVAFMLVIAALVFLAAKRWVL